MTDTAAIKSQCMITIIVITVINSIIKSFPGVIIMVIFINLM